MVDTTIYRWADGALAVDEWCDVNPGRTLVADSFLVVDGCAVAFDRHVERFTRGLSAQALDVAIDDLVAAAVDAIPRDGRWFPRFEAIEYGHSTMVRLLVRPAPEPLDSATLATATVDPRTSPNIKGPDLAALGNLRRDSGGDEAVILDSGYIAEGAWSSIVWWANDELHRVDASIPRLGSVTESVLRDHARYIGAPVHESRITPAELDGAEVWILSALHGIRVVTEWRNGPELRIEEGRATYWRQQYENRRTAL